MAYKLRRPTYWEPHLQSDEGKDLLDLLCFIKSQYVTEVHELRNRVTTLEDQVSALASPSKEH